MIDARCERLVLAPRVSHSNRAHEQRPSQTLNLGQMQCQNLRAVIIGF